MASQMDSVWPGYVKKKKIGQMGPINGGGPLCELSLSLLASGDAPSVLVHLGFFVSLCIFS